MTGARPGLCSSALLLLSITTTNQVSTVYTFSTFIQH